MDCVSRGGGTRTPGLRFWRPPLYQLSYAPEFGKDCSREVSGILKQRRALGALFALLAIGFAGIAFAAAYGARNVGAGWIIALAAIALALWFASMAYRALR
jgi:hypothetical protein